MAIEILSNGNVIRSISHVMSANLCDKLDGTLTFDFTVMQDGQTPVLPGMTVRYKGQYYEIVRVKRGFSAGFEISTVSCEHISYALNKKEYNLVTFVFEGMPKNGLRQLLEGTPFRAGIVEPSGMVECAFTKSGTLSRRSALIQFADACGGELEYDGYAINIRRHRGSTKEILLMDGKNVTGLTATFESRKNTQAYEIQLFKKVPVSVGDEVRIVYTPLSIDVSTRIVGITHNPFDCHSVRVEVGDYVPNLLAAETERLENIRQEFKAANGKMQSTIEQLDGGMSILKQTVDGFDFRIEGSETEVARLSLTVDGFDTRIINAEGNVSTLSQTVNGFDTRIINAEGSVSAISQTVNGISSKVSDAERNISLLTQTTDELSTKVLSAEGNISSLTQKVNGITTRVTNAENDISEIEQTANKISWLVKTGTNSSNFTLTDRAVSIMASSIDLSGYVTVTNLQTAGRSVINGDNITTGTLDASKVTVANLQINNVLYGSYPIITCTGTYGNPVITVGKDQLHNHVSPNKLMIYGTYIQIGDEIGNLYSMMIKSGTISIQGNTVNIGTSSYYAIFNTSREFRPNVNNSSNKFYLGTSSYPWHYGYFSNLYVGGLSVSVTGHTHSEYVEEKKVYRLYAGGGTSYYAELTSSRQFVPSSSSSNYAFYLGTASSPWYYGYISNLTVPTALTASAQFTAGTTIKLGSSTSAKIGFFGTTPITRKSVSTVSSSASASTVAGGLNTLINALKAYGLIA